MYKLFLLIFNREIRASLKGVSAPWFSLSFFILTIMLFPLGIGPDSQLLAEISSGIIWVAALFANLLSLERLFREDYEDGTLQQYQVANISMVIVVLSKCFCHWIITGLPIIFLAPIISSFIYLNSDSSYNLFYSLLLGTPILTLIGAPISALTLGLSIRGPILIFITLPFMIPVLIFGVSAVNSSINTSSSISEIYVLAALFSLAIVLAPLATINALKISSE